MKRAFLTVCVLMALSLCAAQGDTHGVEPLSPPEGVTVAFVPIMKFAPLFVAQERGLFEKYGLEVDLNSVSSGTEAIAFLTEGRIDVAGIAIVTSLWNGWSEGLDIRIFAPGGLEPLENSPTKLMVRRALQEDGAVSSVEDLRGRTVAVAGGPGSGGEYLVAKALELGGLSIRDVNLIDLENADMPAAFEGGAIDAGLLGSPYADQVAETGLAVPLATDLTPGLMTVAFVGSSGFLEERPEAAKRFALALMEAARLMQGEGYLSEENMAAYLRYIDSTEEAIRTGAPVLYDPNQVISTEGLADVERVHRENGRTEYTEPVDLGRVVDTQFVEWARGVLGEASR